LHAFGPFRVDTVRCVLLRDGEPVPLTGKCFEVLLALITRYPETVSKDVLMKSVWPGTFVEESNLTQHISMLRKALGESPQDRLYIVTVPGEGYRLVAEVLELPPESDRRSTLPLPESPVLDDLSQRRDNHLETSSTIFGPTGKAWIVLGLLTAVLIGGAGALWLLHKRGVHALTEKDSILLADFDNSTGEPVFDGTVKEGLAVELGQSPFLDLIGADRVRETLRFMGRSPEEPIKPPLAREICERLGAAALLSGSIARLGKSYVVTVEAEDCADATVLAREQVEAKTQEHVLPALEKVGSKLRRELGESLGSIRQFNAPLEQATTSSLEALKAYSLGVQARTRGVEANAIALFEHAIELDPNFAMAYAQLSAVYSNLGETDKAADYTKRAFALRANLSEREKLYLTARYYTNVTGEIDKATETYELWSKIYPRDWRPFNGLAARYQVIGKYEEARTAAAQALKLQVNHYSPYANLALSQLALGKLDEAQQVCRQASAMGRDSIYTHRVLFEVAFLRHDEPTMQREVDWAKGTENEHEMLTTQALTMAASGRLQAARQLFAQSQAISLRSGLRDNAAYSMAREALVEADFGNYAQARIRALTALQSGKGIDAGETSAEALALSGDEQEVQSLVKDLQQRFPNHGPLNMASLPSALAAMELRRADASKAIKTLETAAPYDLSEFSNLSPVYLRGQAFLRAGSGKEAAAEFQKILDHIGIDATSPRHALAHLGLARALSLTEEHARSRKAYEDFFALWSNADSDIPVLLEARLEYENLK
jgi:eukaryotic-like serine/threonine-protein kinase